ncbi:hypothetical protein GEMRC1_004935 [Eukaryota sp. GEM-RC1]
MLASYLFLVVFLSLIPSCRDLTLQDSSLRWICRHRLLCSQDIVSCNLCSFLRLMLVTAQIVTAVLVIVLLDMTRSRISLPNTSFAVEFKLKLGAAYGVIDLFDPTSKLWFGCCCG